MKANRRIRLHTIIERYVDMSTNLYLMKKDNKYGFINQEGEFVIPPMYKEAENFSEGLAPVITNEGTKGYINVENEWVLQLVADRLYSFVGELASFTRDRKEGIINQKGQITIEPIFDQIYGINRDGTVIGQSDGKMGLYNSQGDVLIIPQYDYVSTFAEELAVVTKGENDGFINRKGEVIIDFNYASCTNFAEGFSVATLDHDTYGFIDKTGEFIIAPTYYQLFDFSEGLAAFRLKTAGKWGFINQSNEVIIKPKFQSVSDFSEGISAVELKDSYGYIDKQGKWIVKNIFSTADSFSNGLGLVTYEGEWGYLNRSGEWVYKPHNFNR